MMGMNDRNADEVLVIDDQVETLELLSGILGEKGYIVRTATDGDLALRSVFASPPTLILLDVKMPVIDGYEVCRKLKSDPKSSGIPVIFITWLEEPGDKARGYGVGGVDYITKPFVKEDVLAQIEAQLRLVHAQNELSESSARLKEEIETRKKTEAALKAREREVEVLLKVSEKSRGVLLSILEDQRRTEEQLRESEERYRMLLNSAEVGVGYWSVDGKLLFFNAKAAEFMGGVTAQYVGKTVYELYGETAGSRYMERIRKAVHSDGAATYQDKVELPDGERWFLSTHGAVRDLNHAVVGVQVISADITERKLAEDRVADALRYAQAIFEASPIGIITYTENGDAISANHAAAAIAGTTVEQLQRQNFRELKSWEEAGLKDAAIAALESNQEKNFEFFVKSSFGRKFWTSAQFVPFVHQGQKELLALFTDITERKRHELEYKTILQTVMDGFLILDTSGKILEVNDAYCAMSGYERGELFSMSVTELHPNPSDPKIGERISRTMKEGAGRFETHHKRKDGRVIEVEVSVQFSDIAGGRMISFVREITERKQAEEALRSSETKLRSIFDTLSEGVALNEIVYDDAGEMIDYRILEVNQAFHTVADFEPGPVVGNVGSRLYGMSPEVVRAFWLSHKGKNEVQHTELLSPRSQRWYLISTSPFINDRFVTSFFDISDLKRVQEQLEQKERQQGLVLGSLPMAFYTAAPTEDFPATWMSKQVEDICGFSGDCFVNNRNFWKNRLHPEDRDRVLTEYASAFKTGGAASEYRWLCSDGSYKWLRDHLVLTRHQDGTPKEAVGIWIDITEGKRAEKELEKERNLLKTLIDSVPDEIAIKDLERRFVLVNPGCVKALRCATTAEVIGKRDEDLIPEQFVARAREDEEWVMKTGQPRINRAGKPRVNPSTGEIERSILISKIPLRDSNGAIVGVVGINRDITEIERTKMALEQSEAKYRSLFEDAAIPIWEEDFSDVKAEFDRLRASGVTDFRAYCDLHPDEVKRCAALVKTMAANDESLRFFQVHSQEELTRSVSEFFVDSSWPIFKEELIALAEGKFRFASELPVKDSSGRRKDLIFRLSVAPSSRTTLSRVLVSFVDITEQKAMERELRKLSRAVEQSPASIVITDVSGSIEYVNPKFEEVTGYSLGEIAGLNPRILSSGHTPSSEYAELWRTVLSGNQWRGEFKNVKKDGTLFWESALISPIFDAKGTITHLLGVKEDISLKKEYEEELLTSHESLRLLAEDLVKIREEERSAIAREVHDELGQILTAVKMDISSLLRVGFANPQAVAKKAESAFSLIDMGIKAVQQLSARLRPGVLDDLGLVAAIEWQADEFRERTGIKCILHMPRTDIQIAKDLATTMFRVFQEGMTNVARHSKARSVEISLDLQHNELSLQILDDGIGITAPQIENQKSLGLIGIRERLRQFDGRLELEARPGGGTLLTVYLPTQPNEGKKE